MKSNSNTSDYDNLYEQFSDEWRSSDEAKSLEKVADGLRNLCNQCASIRDIEHLKIINPIFEAAFALTKDLEDADMTCKYTVCHLRAETYTLRGELEEAEDALKSVNQKLHDINSVLSPLENSDIAKRVIQLKAERKAGKTLESGKDYEPPKSALVG
jgi:hypothetical protein